jgi:hypothetical protein
MPTRIYPHASTRQEPGAMSLFRYLGNRTLNRRPRYEPQAQIRTGTYNLVGSGSRLPLGYGDPGPLNPRSNHEAGYPS